MRRCKKIFYLFSILFFLASVNAHAWTSNEIVNVPMDQWIIQDINMGLEQDGRWSFSYRVTEPAYVILRIHSKTPPFPLIKQILPRVFKNIGTYKEIWDGRDESGHVVGYSTWQVSLKAEPVNFQPSAEELEGANAVPPHPLAIGASHHLHNPSKCGAFSLKIANLKDGDVLQGTHNLSVNASGFYGYTKDIGVSIQVFINSEKVGGIEKSFQEVGELSFHIPIDVSKLPKGKHILRAVIYDYANHYGTASVEFIKE